MSSETYVQVLIHDVVRCYYYKYEHGRCRCECGDETSALIAFPVGTTPLHPRRRPSPSHPRLPCCLPLPGVEGLPHTQQPRSANSERELRRPYSGHRSRKPAAGRDTVGSGRHSWAAFRRSVPARGCLGAANFSAVSDGERAVGRRSGRVPVACESL